MGDTLRPLLKWPGGKGKLAPRIAEFYSNHQSRRLVEPFCGGLSVALYLRPDSALLNDSNPYLINFHRQVQNGLTIPFDDTWNNSDVYYACRARYNELIKKEQYNTPEMALLLYLMNRTGYNGLHRYNLKGGYNVAYAHYKISDFKTTEEFAIYGRALKSYDFHSGDFSELEIQSADFIYVDPPYDESFRKYSKNIFSWEDQVRLIEWLNQFEVPTIISNAPTDRIIQLYNDAGFVVEDMRVQRKIGSTNKSKKFDMELLAYRNL